MIEFKLYIGLNRGTSFDEGPPAVEPSDAMGIVKRYLRAEGSLAATISQAVGIWEDQSESTLVLTLIAPSEERERIESLARNLRLALRQDCIMLTSAPLSHVEFIA
jgi:hypothetical protein